MKVYFITHKIKQSKTLLIIYTLAYFSCLC